MKSALLLTLLLAATAVTASKIHPLSHCSSSSLDIKLAREGIRDMRLEKWDVIPGCEKKMDAKHFYLSLGLTDDLPCGTTRIRNRVTGEMVYYHRLIVTEDNGREHVYKITCLVQSNDETKSNIVKRNVLPAEFVEPDYIEITSEITGMAPVPELSVNVRQGGDLIADTVTVAPGAPLTMEVFLDTLSSSTYGILVSYMLVTDTTDKNETIIYNGCTQDQYVFENFETTNGDFLSAKFRAFKFPGSTYLMFKGNVDVCLDKCQGIRCSNGEIGFGRKRRSISDESNKIFEMTMMTFIKFQQNTSDTEREFRFGSKKQTPSTVYVAQRSEMEVGRSDQPTPYSFFGLNSAASLATNLLLVSILSIALQLA